MKNIILLIGCNLLVTVGLTAQSNNTLRGEIRYMNSGKKPAVGVEIAGTTEADETANVVYTNSKGAYELRFPVSRVGFPVDLKIGTSDGKGKAIEVVNEKEVELCKIPAKVTDVFKVIVCPKGYRDLAAQKYYNIIKTSSDIALAKKEKVLNNLLNDRKKDYQKIADLTAELDRLQQQTDSVKIYKEAFQIASINKDDASKRVLRYIELLEEGKSIQVAREALSIEEASKELDTSISQFKAAVEELERRAGASVAIFDYKDAIACYDTIILKSEKLGISPLKIGLYKMEASEILIGDGYYDKALTYQLDAIDILKKSLNPNHSEVASAFDNIGITYRFLGQFEKALESHKKAIDIRENTLEPDNPDLAITYNNIGNAYQYLGKYENAIEYQLKAIKIQEEKVSSYDPELATSYDNIGNTYRFHGQYDKARRYQQKAVFIRETILDSKHPDLATTYNNIGITYNHLGQYDKALENHNKAIQIREEIFESNHPKLALSYNNISATYQNIGKYEEALENLKKAIKIEEEVLDPNHPGLAASYDNIGIAYQYLGQLENAIVYQKKSIEIREKILDLNHPSLATSYSNIGTTYQVMKRKEKALEYQLKSIRILEEILDPKHPDLATTYNNTAIAYYALGQYTEALDFNQKAISIQEEVLDSNHIRIGISYGAQGKIFSGLLNYKKAISSLKKNIAIFNIALPTDHPYNQKALDYLFDIYKNAAEYYAQQSEKNKSIDYLQSAIEEGFDDLEWITTNDTLAILRSEPAYQKIIKTLQSKKNESIKQSTEKITEKEEPVKPNNTSAEAVSDTAAQKSTPKPMSQKPSQPIDLGHFKITAKTSLREQAGSDFPVLTRLAVGTTVTCLEKTNQYWWKVTYNGKTGYAKAHLLKPIK